MTKDIRLDSNREVVVDDTNDLAEISGIENAKQSVAIGVSVVTRGQIGSIQSPQALESIRSTASEILNADPAVENITAVRISEVNKQTDTISMDVELNFTDTFEVTVDASS